MVPSSFCRSSLPCHLHRTSHFHRLHRLRLYQHPHICHPSYLNYRLVFVVSYLCPRCPVAFSTAPTFSPSLASVLPIPCPFAFKLSPCLHQLFVSTSLRLLTGDIKSTLITYDCIAPP